MSKKTLVIMQISLLLIAALSSAVMFGTKDVSAAYDVTIEAYCQDTLQAVSVDIKMDGAPTGYKTPNTFTGLTGTHTFTVPSTDGHSPAHWFYQWTPTGGESRTITVSSAGTYTANYKGFSVTIRAQCNTEGKPVNVAITMNGAPTGKTTPWTFKGLTSTTTFTVPSTDPSGHAFSQWSSGATSTSISVDSAGFFVAYYGPYSGPFEVIIRARCYAEDGNAVGVDITMDGTSTELDTAYQFIGLGGTHNFTVPSTDPNGHPFTQWHTGETSRTIITSSGGTWDAWYGSYTATIRAHDMSYGYSSTLRPNAFGTYQEWSVSGAATHWEATKDQSDTTYIYSSTNNTRDIQNLQDLPSLGNDWIWSVTVYVRAKATGSGAGETAAILVRTYDTDYEGFETAISRTAFTDYSKIYLTNPKTQLEWTKTEVDNLQAGAIVKAVGGSEQIQVSEIWIIVSLAKAVSVAISMDGTPTGKTTPWSFTGLVGPHGFTVPFSDPYNQPIADVVWKETGDTGLTIPIEKKGTYSAQYQAFSVDAFCYTESRSVSVTVSNGTVSHSTPYTFYGVSSPQTLTVSDFDPTHPFKQWGPPFAEVYSTTLTVSRGKTYTAFYERYDVEIKAYCYNEAAPLSVAITKDGVPTGFNTPHTFYNLTAGDHTFTVPNVDANTHPFMQWGTSPPVLTTTLTTGPAKRFYNGSYTAYYGTYSVTVNAYCYTEGKFVSLPITKDGVPTGYNTPYTFAGLAGTHTFTLPSTESSGHLFWWWKPGGEKSTTITVTASGTYTGYYLLPPLVYVDPPTIGGAVNDKFTVRVRVYNLTDSYLVDPVNPTTTYPLGNLYSLDITFIWNPAVLEYKYHNITIPVEKYFNGTLHETIMERNNDVDAITGTYHIQYTSWYPAAPFNNPGNSTVFTMTFGLKALALSYLNLTSINLADKDGKSIPYTTKNGFLILGGDVNNDRKVNVQDLFALGKAFGLASIENYVTSTVVNGSYLYAGLCTSPGRIVKINLADFTKVSTLTLGLGEDYVSSLAVSGSYLYAGLQTNPGKVVKIDSTFNKVSTLALPSTEPFVTSLAVRGDGAFLFAGVHTSPARVVKIDLSTFLRVTYRAGASGEPNVRSMVITADSFLYVGIHTFPGKIIKFDVRSATFTKLATLALGTGEDDVRSLAVSGSFLYAGLDTSPAKIVKVNLLDFTKSSTLTLNPDEKYARSLAVRGDGAFLYAGLYTLPGKVAKVDLSTFTRSDALTLSPGENYITSMAVDSSFLYAGLDTSPAKIVKINLSTFVKVSTLTPTPPSPNWNPNCDINKDQKVDTADLTILMKNYGKTV